MYESQAPRKIMYGHAIFFVYSDILLSVIT